MPEKLTCVPIDNRRPENRIEKPYHHLVDQSSLHCYSPYGFYPQETWTGQTHPDVLRIRGGDGTNRALLNFFSHLAKNGFLLPAFWHEDGGSANTLLKGLSAQDNIDLPEKLAEIFLRKHFAGRTCFPLTIDYADEKQPGEYGAYLAGFSQLEIGVTQIKEAFAARKMAKNTHLTYVLSGLTSIAALNRRREPQRIRYFEDDQWKNIEGLSAACAVITVPFLGTFKFNAPIPPDKIRLLTITAESYRQLAYKYIATLIIGGLINPNLVVGPLVEKHDVDKVQITPQKTDPPNCCFDGELVKRKGELTIGRSKQGVLFVLPKQLIYQFNHH